MQYKSLRKIRTELDKEILTEMKAGKREIVVLMDKNKRYKTFVHFIQEKKIKQTKTDPTTTFQKETQQAIQQCKKV